MTQDGIDLTTFNKEEAIASFNGIDTQGFQLLVLLYIPPKKIGAIYLPDQTHEEYQYRACTGLVVQRGKASYGQRFEHLSSECQVWCDVGDWIAFPRHEGIQVKIDGRPCQFLNDASVLARIDSPLRIER